MRKTAIIMQLPEGKLPGFYAQVIKALATTSLVFDREKEILIVERTVDLSPIEQILDQYNILFETIPLLHMPSSAILSAHYEDFGFTTRSGNTFLYDQSLIIFTFKPSHRDDENVNDDYTMALEQLGEHTIAAFQTDNCNYYIAEEHLEDCIYGIAKAYQCIFKLKADMEGPLESTL